MNDAQWKKSQEIGSYLKRYLQKRTPLARENSIRESDRDWPFSRFLAQILCSSTPHNFELPKSQFEQFVKNYEEESGLKVDQEGLFGRYWLRHILGTVKISGTVSFQAYRFGEFSGFKEELTFLFELAERQPDRVMTPDELSQEVLDYESQTGKTLQRDGIYYKSWLSTKEGQIKLSDLNYHYKPFLEYWDDFLFLNALYRRKDRTSRCLVVEKDYMLELHRQYGSLFSQTPSLEELQEENLFEIIGNHCHFTLDSQKNESWQALNGSIAAHYWAFLLADTVFEDDKQRLLKFLNQTAVWRDYADPLIHSTRSDKKRFLDAACTLLLEETDLLDTEEEIRKVTLDSRHGETYWLSHETNPYHTFDLDNSDCYELIRSLRAWETTAQITHLYSQQARHSINYLIWLVIRHDIETETLPPNDSDTIQTVHFPRIVSFLENSLIRPNLLWKTSSVLIENRPEVIPFLIGNKKLISLAFYLLNRVKFVEDFTNIQKESWIKSLRFSQAFLGNISENKALGAKIIWQLFRQINSSKYQAVGPYQNPRVAQESRKKDRDKELLILKELEGFVLNKYTNTLEKDYLLSHWLPSIIHEIINFQPTSRVKNGTYRLPLLQWDAMTWVLRISYLWKYKKSVDINHRRKVTDHFINVFQEAFSLISIPQIDFTTRKEVQSLPSWYETIEPLERIDWIYLLYELEKEGRLYLFLYPTIEFKTDLIQDDAFIRLQTSKYRTLLSLMILTVENLVEKDLDQNLDERIIRSVQKKIEVRIAELLKTHKQERPDLGEIDLFDSYKETGIAGRTGQALFPRLSRILNYFHNKQELTSIIAETQDLLRILSIAEYFGSEGLRDSLMAKVSNDTVKHFLQNTYWATEVHLVLDQLQQYGKAFLGQLKEVIAFWEKNIAQKSSDYKGVLFRAKLLVAYINENEQELNEIIKPDNKTVHHVDSFSSGDEREYFRALILLQKKPERSLEIFDRLADRHPQYPNLALHRVRTKIMLTDKKSSPSDYLEILQEWEDYQSKAQIKTEDLGAFYSTQMLHLYLRLSQYDQLDKLYGELSLLDQMRLENGEPKVLSLLERGYNTQALLIIHQLEEYHQLTDPVRKAELQDLRDKIDETDNLMEMRNQYGLIHQLPPNQFVKILPNYLNGEKKLHSFFVHEFIRAAGQMLDKIASLNNIDHEDKYNDLMELALTARFSSWGWNVNEQSRGGYAHNEKPVEEKNPGSRDFKITDSASNQLMICEALIYRNKKQACDHLTKVFNYTHDHRGLLILIYHRGEANTFESHWQRYLKSWLPATSLSDELSLMETLEVSSDFNFASTSMRVAKSKHQNGTEVYHLMIDLRYHQPIS